MNKEKIAKAVKEKLKNRKLSDEDRLTILGNVIGLTGMGGECGSAAIAINDLLFEGKGKLVAAVNFPIWKREKRIIGHVGVKDARNSIWDIEGTFDGKEGHEEFRAKGMLDYTDTDYKKLLHTEEESLEAKIIEVTISDIIRSLGKPNKKYFNAILEEKKKLGFI